MDEQEIDAVGPTLNGAERAAVVLYELGEDVAVSILRQLNEAAVTKVCRALNEAPRIPEPVRLQIMASFSQDLGFTFIGRALETAFGVAEGRAMLERISRKEPPPEFEFPSIPDPRSLARRMIHERPQTIALLLSQIPSQTGAAILSLLPAELAAEALFRFTHLDSVSRSAFDELRDIVKEFFSDGENDGLRLQDVGGAKQTASILNQLQSNLSENVIKTIETYDKKVALEIRQNLFVFADLVHLSDRALQILLREIPEETLAIALRMTTELVKRRFYRNVSERKVEILQEELLSGPPRRRSDVLDAQSQIVKAALELASEGKIVINASEELA